MACEACHGAKVKCNKKIPCARCLKMNIPCVPHVSRQGQGSKKRKRRKQSEDDDTTTTTQVKNLVENTFLKKNKTFLDVGGSKGRKGGAAGATPRRHYGLYHLLRQWISLAFTRRTFRLLQLVSKLAIKNGISMDQILCGKDNPIEWTTMGGNDEDNKNNNGDYDGGNSIIRHNTNITSDIISSGRSDIRNRIGISIKGETKDLKMNYLPDVLLKSSEEQLCNTSVTDGRRPLGLEEIPNELFTTMRCRFRYCNKSNEVNSTININKNEEETPTECCSSDIKMIDLESRWVFAREIDQGHSRFFVSKAFGCDVVSLQTIEKVYDENKTEIMSLWMPSITEREKFCQSLVHQVGLNHSPNIYSQPDRVIGTKIRLQASKSDVMVDAIVCYRILGLDRGIIFIEYIPTKEKNIIPPVVMPGKAPTSSNSNGHFATSNINSQQHQNNIIVNDYHNDNQREQLELVRNKHIQQQYSHTKNENNKSDGIDDSTYDNFDLSFSDLPEFDESRLSEVELEDWLDGFIFQ